MILAILQARTSSTRLPGKVLLPLCGKPMILRQVERILRSKMIDHLVVATSVDSSDNPLVAVCQEAGIPFRRGSLNDVLDRFWESAKDSGADHVVRLTGDCPLCDPEVIDQLVQFHLSHGFDYTSNIDPPTYPDGLDVEVFRVSCLHQAWKEASLYSEREHVTPYIRKHGDLFLCGNLRNDKDLSFHRWTVDEPADYAFALLVYENLYENNPNFGTNDVLNLLEIHPEFCRNYSIERNSGYVLSLKNDFHLSADKSGRGVP